MTVLVTGCHDCPFSFYSENYKAFGCSANYECMVIVDIYVFDQKIPTSCPLQTESITIKKKDNGELG